METEAEETKSAPQHHDTATETSPHSKQKVEIFLVRSPSPAAGFHRHSAARNQPVSTQNERSAPTPVKKDNLRTSICVGTEDSGVHMMVKEKRRRLLGPGLSGIMKNIRTPVAAVVAAAAALSPDRNKNLMLFCSGGVPTPSGPRNSAVAGHLKKLLQERLPLRLGLSRLAKTGKTSPQLSPQFRTIDRSRPRPRQEGQISRSAMDRSYEGSPARLGRLTNLVRQEPERSFEFPEAKRKRSSRMQGRILRASTRCEISGRRSPICHRVLAKHKIRLPPLEVRRGQTGTRNPLEFGLGSGKKKFNARMKFWPIADGYRILLASDSADQDSIIPTMREVKADASFIH